MQKIDAQNPPQDALVREFCMRTDEDQARFVNALSRFFPDKIRRLGVVGGIGSGKSTLALGLLNTFGVSTIDAGERDKNRGDWQSPQHGVVSIYDNFSIDYHRFNMAEDPETNASVVIVEHANLDRKPFDSVVMLNPGDGHPCVKNIKLVMPPEMEDDPDFMAFAEETEDMLLHNRM